MIISFQKISKQWAHLYLLLGVTGAQVGLVAASADIAELLHSLGWHRLGEAKAAPRVRGRADLCHYRLPLHG